MLYFINLLPSLRVLLVNSKASGDVNVLRVYILVLKGEFLMRDAILNLFLFWYKKAHLYL